LGELKRGFGIGPGDSGFFRHSDWRGLTALDLRRQLLEQICMGFRIDLAP
jgi:hypothetical protein